MTGERVPSPMEERLREIIERYLSEGWQAEREPDPEKLPGALHGTRVDVIFHRGQDIIIGEAVYRGSTRQEHMETLARQVATIPNARLEVYWIGDTPIVRPDPGEVRRYIAEAEAIISDSPQAALLMASAAFEGAIATFADEAGIRLKAPAKQLLANLYSLGYVDEADFSRLSALYTLRSAIAHTATPVIPETEAIRLYLDLATRMLNGRYISADQMIEWFKKRYERPQHRVPSGDRQGDHLFTGGEPYEAGHVLREQFPYASEQAVADAIRWLEDDSFQWIRRKPGRS